MKFKYIKRIFFGFFIIVIILLLGSRLPAAIINIPGDYPLIQMGIEVASTADTVLVQPGTYTENINFEGKNITVGSLHLLSNDTTYILTTIIDGDSSASVVTFNQGESSEALITGFTLRRGYADFGGGVLCDSAGPTIESNIITGNLACMGGGIYCYKGSPIISRNKICFNTGLG